MPDESAIIVCRVLLFASLADAAGARELHVELRKDGTVNDALAEVKRRFDLDVRTNESIACAVNEQYISRDHVLADGDTLALIPPVSGG